MNESSEKQKADAWTATTILVVEDSEIASMLICDVLETRGYNLERASCGQEALDWLQYVKPDLLLLDFKLPDFNGNVLIKRIAEQGITLPFIVITGHGDENVAVEMMKLGAIDYLVKDKVFMELLPAVVEQALQTLHNQRRLLDTEAELRLAEQDLAFKEDRFSELFNHVSSGVAVYEAVDDGADFVFVDLNAATERIENVVRDELIGCRLSKAFPGAEDIGLVSALRRAWQSGEKQNLPISFYHDGRVEGWRENRIYLLSTGEVVAVYDDVTERKRAEQKVLENEEKLRLLINSKSEAIYSVDLEGTCIFCNDSCLSLLGYEHENDLLGHNIHSLAHHTNHDGSHSSIEQCKILDAINSTKKVNMTDDIFWRADGEWLHVDWWASPIIKADTVIGAVVTFIDVAEQRKQQIKDIRANQLASLGEMAAGVAHEINNPINGIINYAQLLVKYVEQDSYEHKLLKGINKEGWRIASIVKNLLSHARNDEGRIDLVCMEEVLDESMSLIRTQIEKEGIILDIEQHHGLPMVRGNKQQLEQILINLISNSRHALNERFSGTHIDKILRISLTESSISNKKYVGFVVWDQGGGISGEIFNKVMNPFFTTKPAGVGTGLGLSISHEIAKAHEGHISINSEPGMFTSVEVLFPAA